MRFLISAACVAIIVFVGYFFWGEYSQSQAEAWAKSDEAKRRQDLSDTCDRLTTNDPKYDESYSASLSKEERIKLADKCIAFDGTGELP